MEKEPLGPHVFAQWQFLYRRTDVLELPTSLAKTLEWPCSLQLPLPDSSSSQFSSTEARFVGKLLPTCPCPLNVQSIILWEIPTILLLLRACCTEDLNGGCGHGKEQTLQSLPDPCLTSPELAIASFRQLGCSPYSNSCAL